MTVVASKVVSIICVSFSVLGATEVSLLTDAPVVVIVSCNNESYFGQISLFVSWVTNLKVSSSFCTRRAVFDGTDSMLFTVTVEAGALGDGDGSVVLVLTTTIGTQTGCGLQPSLWHPFIRHLCPLGHSRLWSSQLGNPGRKKIARP